MTLCRLEVNKGLQELLLMGQVVIVLACQLTLAMFMAVQRRGRRQQNS